jgi:hypothetical protein
MAQRTSSQNKKPTTRAKEKKPKKGAEDEPKAKEVLEVEYVIGTSFRVLCQRWQR